MKKTGRIIAFLLVASAFVEAAHAQTRVFVTRDLSKATTLQSSIAAFKESTTQLRFATDPGNADASYVDFEIQTRKLNKLIDVGLISKFSRSHAPQFARYASHCGGCEIDSLFADVVDQTLFGVPAVYPPLTMEDCSADGLNAIHVVVKPITGIGLERKIFYGVRLSNVVNESPLLLVSESAQPWDATTARLTLANYAISQWARFRQNCGLPDGARRRAVRSFVLVPHKVSPQAAGSLNPSAIRATQ